MPHEIEAPNLGRPLPWTVLRSVARAAVLFGGALSTSPANAQTDGTWLLMGDDTLGGFPPPPIRDSLAARRGGIFLPLPAGERVGVRGEVAA